MMDEESNKKGEELLRIQKEYGADNHNGSEEMKASEYGKDLDNSGIDSWINSDLSPSDHKAMTPESNSQRRKSTDENDAKKRKRGRRGGKRRGIVEQKDLQSGGLRSGKARPRRRGNQRSRESRRQGASNVASLSNLPDGIIFVEDGSYTGYHCAYCNCQLNSLPSIRSHVGGNRHRNSRQTRHQEQKKKRGANAANSEAENRAKDVASLHNLPDGILLVEHGNYVGYHCTYCNCALNHASSIDPHVAGFRHQLIIEARNRLEEQKKTEGDGKKSILENKTEEKDAGLLEDSTSKAPVSSEDSLAAVSEQVIEAKGEKAVGLLLEESTSKVPVMSSLEEALAEVSEPVIGLDYIIKKQKQGEEPSYECSLCSVISEVDDMKAHILGTRHRLMYMKKTDPQKIAELMAKNLPKAERNKEIKEYITSAMAKYGKGTIVVETSEASLSKAPEKKGHQETSDMSRKSVGTARSAHRKRTNEEEDSSRKKRRSDKSNSGMRVTKEKFTGKDRHSYGSDKGRSVQPSPSRQKKEETANDPPKLPDIEVTNEEEAGIVMNVINSLTERFLQYKLKNISGQTREILEKSLKGEKLIQALSLLSDENNGRTTDKPSIPPKYDKVPQPQPERTMAKSYQDFTQRTDMPMRNSGQAQLDWNEGKGALYSEEKTYQTYNEWTKQKAVTDRSQYDWNTARDGKSADSIRSSHGWDQTRDGRARDQKDRIPSLLEIDVRPNKGMTDYQLQKEWNIRGNIHNEDRMTQSDWNRAGNTAGIKSLTKNVTDQLRYDWHETKNSASSRGDKFFDLPQNSGDVSRSSSLETKRNSLSQYPLSWNEPRMSSNTQNKDSLSKTAYLDKFESIPSLRSTASFNQQQQSWGVDGKSQAQAIWNTTDKNTGRGGTDRSFGQPVLDRNDSIYGRGTTDSLAAQILQSNLLPQRGSVSHRTSIDDLFNKYGKNMQSGTGRNLLTTMSGGNQSYVTPTVTAQSHYLGPSTSSTFKRPSTFGQSQSTSSYLRWK